MRRLVLLEHMSLDGYLGAPDGSMDWLSVDDEIFEHTTPIVDAGDMVIWGRTTYEMMVGYWPTAAEQPGAGPHDVHHSTWTHKSRKVVYSTTLELAMWPGATNIEVVHSVDAAQVEGWKREPGKDILLIGSPRLAQSFIAASLVDDYYINLNPVIVGAGPKLFPDGYNLQSLELLGAKQFSSGVLGLHYRTR